MPTPRRILPQDKLETGFRAAHNQTVDALIDASRCRLSEEGILRFHNDEGVFLGEIDLSPLIIYPPDSSAPNPDSFLSASEEDEGLIRLSTPGAALTGEDEYTAISPAALAYVLSERAKSGDVFTLQQILFDGGADTDVMPRFGGGLSATLPGKQAGQTAQKVVVGEDGTLYKTEDTAGEVPKTTFDESVAANPNSNRPIIYGPDGQANPQFNEGFEFVRTSYFHPVAQVFFHTLTSLKGLVAKLRPYFGLTDILAVSNVSDGTAVFGGLGLFERVRSPTARKYPVLVDAVVQGRAAYFVEYQEAPDVLAALFENLSPEQKSYVRAAISAEADAAGIVTGIRCLDTPGLNAGLDDAYVDLTGKVNGDAVLHSLGPGPFLFAIYDQSGRLDPQALIQPDGINQVRFRNPGITEPYAGMLHLKKKPTLTS